MKNQIDFSLPIDCNVYKDRYKLGSLLKHHRPGSLLKHHRPGSLLKHHKPGSLLKHHKPGSLLKHHRPGSLLKHHRPGSLLIPPRTRKSMATSPHGQNSMANPLAPRQTQPLQDCQEYTL